MCPFSYVRQFHLDADGSVGVEITLGEYQMSMTEYNLTSTPSPRIRQHYKEANGNRHVTVDILCSSKAKTYLRDMVEDPIHVYNIKLYTPLICSKRLGVKTPKKELPIARLLS